MVVSLSPSLGPMEEDVFVEGMCLGDGKRRHFQVYRRSGFNALFLV